MLEVVLKLKEPEDTNSNFSRKVKLQTDKWNFQPKLGSNMSLTAKVTKNLAFPGLLFF